MAAHGGHLEGDQGDQGRGKVKVQKESLTNDMEVKLTGVSTDIKNLHKVAKDLPKDGNLDAYIKSRIEHVQVLETMGLAGGIMDDTLDMGNMSQPLT